MDASQLDASAFEPYFGGKLNAIVSSALLNANGDASFSGEGRALKAGYKGDVSLSNVRMIDKATSEPLAGWKLLGLTNLKARYDEHGTDVDAARVTFANFYGRVLLDAQGKLNLRDIVVQGQENGHAQAVTRDSMRSKAAPEPARLAPPPARPKRAENRVAPANLHFGQLVLQHGRVTYTDNFIKPNFTANLVAITGRSAHSARIRPRPRRSMSPRNSRRTARCRSRDGQSADRETGARSDRERARHRADQSHAVFGEIRGLSDHQGQAQRRPALQARQRTAEREQPHLHRSTHVRRSRRQRHGDQAAGAACDFAAEEFARRNRREHSGVRLAVESASSGLAG